MPGIYFWKGGGEMAHKKAQPKDQANVLSAEAIQQSAIQQGSPHATQTVTITVEAKKTLESVIGQLLASLDKLGLDTKQTGEVKANAEAVQALLKTEKPKPSVLRECLVSIKDTLQAAAVAAVTSDTGQLITNMLHQINKVLGIG